ncbi:MAG: dCTP deaminase [Candidatus Saccharibacteria bacterium]|nr:dCTP deaminase [Candidatus Saccharibacteria bacterium]MCY4088697.1 dCTP deaminase [Candidatus Saccharibacteria bacterium]
MSQTGVYSNKQILKAIEAKQIVIHPFNPKHLAGSSVDVTLGDFYYRTEHNTASNFYNPFDKSEVEKYFSGPHQAQTHDIWAQESGRQLFVNVPAQQPIIVVKPGERILAHTHEFIGIKPPGTSTMQARSTWGRNGITVCLDAGWGDPGYINRWTMEVYNLNQHHSVVLPVGERIAQIVFYHTGEVDSDYGSLSGKYQASSDIETLIKTWQPSQMLPKAYHDKRMPSLEL